MDQALMDHPLVAVLGGGQLGRMLGLAGVPMGVVMRFLDPSPDACAGAVGSLVVAALDDVDAVRRFAEDATVVTYEWEGVPADTVRAIEACATRPGARALEVAQDRLGEKETFTRLGIAVAPYAPMDRVDDARRCAGRHRCARDREDTAWAATTARVRRSCTTKTLRAPRGWRSAVSRRSSNRSCRSSVSSP